MQGLHFATINAVLAKVDEENFASLARELFKREAEGCKKVIEKSDHDLIEWNNWIFGKRENKL